MWWRTPSNVNMQEHGVNPNTVVRTPITHFDEEQGYYETENDTTWVSVLPGEIIEPTPAKPKWVPINDYPGDQQYDIPVGTETESFWAEIGNEGDCWSYTIMATNDGETYEVANGRCASEAAVKTTVEGWRP